MENISQIAKHYKKVIDAWKNRTDVQSGEALAYRKGQSVDGEYELINKPHSIGEGTVNSGWCVSVSQALLVDSIFNILLQERKAVAKLISIDIKEQFYGKIFMSGTQNKWHTAVFVQDSGINLVIDLTCGQFGNAYVNKNIWDFNSWEKTFRSPMCKHKITDFQDNILSYIPITAEVTSKKTLSVETENNFHDITSLTDNERKMLSDFFYDKLSILNKKLLIGNIIDDDFNYMSKLNKLLQNFRFVTTNESNVQYYIMPFNNMDSAKLWLKKFLKTESDGGYIMPQYIVTSNSVKSNCDFFGINFDKINTDSSTAISYILFKINKCSGVDVSQVNNLSMCIPYGIKVTMNPLKDIYNGGKELSPNTTGQIKKTNTIIINCEIQ